MTNKKSKIKSLINESVEAELLETDTTKAHKLIDEFNKQNSKSSLPKEEILKARSDELLNKHKEKGSLAFEILKTSITQEMDSLIRGVNFEQLVTNAYKLADAFKLEMDVRYTKDITELTETIFGKISESTTQESVSTDVNKEVKTIN